MFVCVSIVYCVWGGVGTAKPSSASPVYGVLLYNHKHNISEKRKLHTITPVNRAIPSSFWLCINIPIQG